jgi:hypothetical protein
MTGGDSEESREIAIRKRKGPIAKSASNAFERNEQSLCLHEHGKTDRMEHPQLLFYSE